MLIEISANSLMWCSGFKHNRSYYKGYKDISSMLSKGNQSLFWATSTISSNFSHPILIKTISKWLSNFQECSQFRMDFVFNENLVDSVHILTLYSLTVLSFKCVASIACNLISKDPNRQTHDGMWSIIQTIKSTDCNE